MSLSRKAIDTLTARITGEVIPPSDPKYQMYRRVFNGKVLRRPAIIVRPRGSADVREAINCARANSVRVSAKCGGHGPTGFAVQDDALLLDLSLMRGVSVDRRTRNAVVEAGALWKDVDTAAAFHRLLPVGGGCNMVGVAGFTLGGGWGFLSRSLGLAIDNLESVELVTAEGALISASETENGDLFWALRGSGGGNFGIVTAFKYRLHPLQDVFGGTMWWPIAKAHEVLKAYRDLLVAGPPDSLYFDVSLYTDPEDGQQVSITAVYLGAEVAGRKALEPLIALADPAATALNTQPLRAVLDNYAEEIIEGRLELWKSRYLDMPLTDATIHTIAQWYGAAPGPASLFFIETLGGAIARVPSRATAYPHRHQLMCATIIGISDEVWRAPETERWAREFYAALAPATSGAVYVNYPDVELPEWAAAYYGDNYARLRKVKKTYDPEDFFRFEQSIQIQ